MKRLIVPVFALVLMVTTDATAFDAHGSAFGTLATAKAAGQGNGTFGLGVGIADATSVVGWLNYGLSSYVDGRVKLGLIDVDGGDTEITFGADFKYQFWSVGGAVANPIDMALGGFMEFVDYGPFSIFQVGGQLMGSYPFTLANGTVISPYGRFNVRLERSSWESRYLGYRDSGSDSNLEFGLNGGAAWQVTNSITLYGEFQIDGNEGIFLGIDFLAL